MEWEDLHISRCSIATVLSNDEIVNLSGTEDEKIDYYETKRIFKIYGLKEIDNV